jgi:hypothetical protein
MALSRLRTCKLVWCLLRLSHWAINMAEDASETVAKPKQLPRNENLVRECFIMPIEVTLMF